MVQEYRARLRRRIGLDKDNGWILGVCAGLADYCRLDPAIVRVAAVIAALFLSKLVIAVYLLAWFFLDDRPLRQRDDGADETPGWRARDWRR